MIALGSAAVFPQVIATGDIARISRSAASPCLGPPAPASSMRGRAAGVRLNGLASRLARSGRWRLVLALVLFGAAVAGPGGPFV